MERGPAVSWATNVPSRAITYAPLTRKRSRATVRRASAAGWSGGTVPRAMSLSRGSLKPSKDTAPSMPAPMAWYARASAVCCSLAWRSWARSIASQWATTSTVSQAAKVAATNTTDAPPPARRIAAQHLVQQRGNAGTRAFHPYRHRFLRLGTAGVHWNGSSFITRSPQNAARLKALQHMCCLPLPPYPRAASQSAG